jgi:hypothetical protein
LFDRVVSLLLRGKSEAQIMLALYFKSQTMVARPSAVMRLHSLDAGQWDAVTNVRASDGL